MWDRTENKIILTLIRHGRTPMNLEGRYIGRTDESLAAEGIAELREKWPRSCMMDLVFTSPMKRCMESAEVIFGNNNKNFIPIPQWSEMDFGLFEGKNYEELNGNPVYQKWIDSGGTDTFPGGEDMTGFRRRVMDGFDLFMEICRNIMNGEDLYAAALVHGGTIMALLSDLTGQGYYDFQSPNGSGYTIELSTEGKLLKEPEKIIT